LIEYQEKNMAWEKIPHTIAIDGPAASGKTTLAIHLAEKLGYLYFDTGVMYRAVTLMAIQKQIDPEDGKRVTQLAESIQIDVRTPTILDGRNADVFVDGQDVTWEIRSPEVEKLVSIVSAHQGVREALTAQQRKIGLRGKVVMVGRDIGTVVLPEAELKIYLDASVKERARRRFDEIRQRGEKTTYEDILNGMRLRDKIDSSRDIAPLKPANDAVILSTDELSIDQVLERTIMFVEAFDQKKE
jgi:CMP/dCMP kinase